MNGRAALRRSQPLGPSPPKGNDPYRGGRTRRRKQSGIGLGADTDAPIYPLPIPTLSSLTKNVCHPAQKLN